MTTPISDEQRWAQAVAEVPELAKRWSATLPRDSRGRVLRGAFRDYERRKAKATKGGIKTPDPVDWGQRAWDIYGGVPGLGLTVQALARAAPGRLGELARDWSPDLSESSIGALIGEATFMPFVRALDAWQETVEPGAATLNALFEPGVRERYGVLRERGVGPVSAIQSAYDQAKEEGEIPWWQSLPTEILTDPIELIPVVGIYGAATKAATKGGFALARGAGRGIRAAEVAAAKAAARQTAESAQRLERAKDVKREGVLQQAKDYLGQIETPSPPTGPTVAPVDMSRYAMQSTFLDEAGRTVAPTEEVVSRIPGVTGAPGTQSTFLDESVEGGVRNFATRQVWEFPADYAYKTPLEELTDPPGVLPTPAQMFPERPFPTTGEVAIAETMANVGTVSGGLKGTTPVHVVEWEPWVIEQYNITHGTNFTAQDIADNGALAALKASNAEHYHASPVCKNVSKANFRAKISDNDWAIARAVARDIREVQTPSITIENVPQYKGTLLYKQIVDALEDSGYIWDEVITDVADWGAPQFRSRLFIRATKRGALPPLPTPIRAGLYWEQEGRTWLLKGTDQANPAGGDWYELLKDLIDMEIRAGREEIARLGSTDRIGKVSDLRAKLDKTKVNDDVLRMRKAISGTTKTGKPIEVYGAKLNEDSYIFNQGGSAVRGKPAATNVGRPAPTLLAGKHAPRIFLTGNGVKLEDAEFVRVTPRMMARLMGLSDDFKVPSLGVRGGVTEAKQVMGNGVHTKHTELFIQPMVDKVARTRPVPGEGQVLIGGKWVWPVDRPENIISPTQGVSKWLNVNTLPKVEPHELDELLADDLLSSLVKAEVERRLRDPMNAFSVNPISYATRNLFVREITKEMGRVAKATGKKPPTYEMVEDYLTRLVSGDPIAGVDPAGITAGGRAIQGRLFDAEVATPRMLEASTWDEWLNDYYKVNPDGSYTKITNRPISGAKKGTKTQAEEAELSEVIEAKSIVKDGDPFRELERKGVVTSSWMDPSKPGGLDWSLWTAKIVDGLRGSIREMATPAEKKSYKGIKGTLTRGLLGTHYAIHSTALRRYEAITRQIDRAHEYVREQGTKELQEMGWLDKNSIPTELAEGVFEVDSRTGAILIDDPGPLEILRRALHAKSEFNEATGLLEAKALNGYGETVDYMAELRRHGPDAERQYGNLRAMANMEEIFRNLDPNFQGISNTDYFYRGMILPEDMDRVTTKLGGDIGRRKSFERARKQVSRLELKQEGMVDLFYNPYQMVEYSARMGLAQRLQRELVDILTDETIGLAHLTRRIGGVYDDTPYIAQLRDQGWRVVDNAGPALKGPNEEAQAVMRKQVNVPEKDQVTQSIMYEYIFHPEAARALEDMFASPAPIWQWFKQQRRIKGIGNVKPDDLIFLPKRAKLFGSLFQQIDFGQRAGIAGTHLVMWRMIEGMKLLGKGNIDKGFTELVNAAWDIRLIPRVWWDMAKAYISPSYRANLNRLRLSTKPFYDDPALAEYNWNNMFLNGLHVTDTTIIRADEAQEMLRAAASASGNPIKTGAGWFKKLEQSMRNGLFDGVYPAAIMHDVRYNILPMVRAANPDMNPSEIMGIVTNLANIKWSTIPASQSVFKGSLRQALTRSMFSIQEFEAVGRQTTGAISGPNANYWRMHWASALVFWMAVGNTIHLATTSLTKVSDKEGMKPDLSMGQLLPVNRYIPFQFKDWHSLGWGYNPEFLAPDIPVPTRSGDRAKLDLLMQLDLVFRLLDGSHGVPLAGFVDSRLGAMPRAFAGWVTGEDFYGRDTEKWGYGQKALQFVYDAVAPIGAGQLSVALAQVAMKDKELPGLPAGALIPGGTVGEVGPSVENTIGLLGHGLQSIGLNVKALTKEAIRDEMVERTFGTGGDHVLFPNLQIRTYAELKDHPESKTLWQLVNEDPKNSRYIEELDLRAQEGSESFYDNFSKLLHENKEITKSRREKDVGLVEKHQSSYVGVLYGDIQPTNEKKAWSPSGFRKDLSILNDQTTGARAQAEKIYGEDPRVAQAILSKEEPSRVEDPLDWAIFRYYSLRDEYRDSVTQKVDYRRFEAAWKEEQARWVDDEGDSNGLVEIFDRWLNYGRDSTGMHPFIKEYYDAIESLRQSGYWNDTPPDAMARLVQAFPAAPDIWANYLSSSKEERARLRVSRDRNAAMVIKVMEQARRTHKKKVVLENPGLDLLRVMWFGNVPYIRENRQLFYKLYGRYPASMSRHESLAGAPVQTRR